MNDPTTRMIIKEVGCGNFAFDFKSAAMPKEPKIPETVFSLGEEFVYENPFDPTDPLKVSTIFLLKNFLIENIICQTL